MPYDTRAQITSDDAKNPILTGDRIYSQVWDRGRTVGFAVAGDIDLDKDGQDDLQRRRRRRVMSCEDRSEQAGDGSGLAGAWTAGNHGEPTIECRPSSPMLSVGPVRTDGEELGERLERHRRRVQTRTGSGPELTRHRHLVSVKAIQVERTIDRHHRSASIDLDDGFWPDQRTPPQLIGPGQRIRPDQRCGFHIGGTT